MTAFAVFAAGVFLHLPVSDACDAVIRRVGFDVVDAASRAVAALAGVGFVAIVWWRGRERRTLLIASAAALVVLAAAASRWMLVSGLESVHFPQYAVLFALLRRAGLSLSASWTGATTLGIVDEAYQYLAMPRGTPAYYDWNDVLLDAIGATCGLLLLAAAGERNRDRATRGRGAVVAGSLAAVVAIESIVRGVLVAGTSTHQPAVVLTAAQALLVAALLWWLATTVAAPAPPAVTRRASGGVAA